MVSFTWMLVWHLTLSFWRKYFCFFPASCSSCLQHLYCLHIVNRIDCVSCPRISTRIWLSVFIKDWTRDFPVGSRVMNFFFDSESLCCDSSDISIYILRWCHSRGNHHPWSHNCCRRSAQACCLCSLWSGVSIHGTNLAHSFLYWRLPRIVLWH